MRSKSFVLGSVLGALLLVGCGGDGSEKSDRASTVSCRVESPGNGLQCIEYGVPPDAVTATRDGCTAGGGTIVSSCPKENSLGTCTNNVSDTITIVTRYYSGGITPETAEELCSANGGSWDPV